MDSHDLNSKVQESRLIAEKISQSFSLNMLDVIELMQKNSDPILLAALMFKLAQEREQANKELQRIHDKFDEIMLELKTRNSTQATQEFGAQDNGRKFEILPEQDQKILSIIGQKGPTNASEIQNALGYKGINAASQRLNLLFRQGVLKKIQSGKKVLYFTP
jgi:hypothetical protein